MSWVFLEHFGDEVLGSGGEGNVVWECIVAHLDPVIGGFDIVSLEGRSAYQAGIGDDSQTPDIHFVGMPQGLIICM